MLNSHLIWQCSCFFTQPDRKKEMSLEAYSVHMSDCANYTDGGWPHALVFP